MMAENNASPVSGNVDEVEGRIQAVERLLRPDITKVRSLEAQLGKVAKNDFILLTEPVAHANIVNLALTKIMLDQGFDIIYVTFNRDSDTWNHEFKVLDLPPKRIAFVDATTRNPRFSGMRPPFVISLEHSGDLMEIPDAIDAASEKLGPVKQCVILDSLSTLLIFNRSQTVEKFAHVLRNHLHERNMAGLVLAGHETSTRLVNIVAPFFDRVINLPRI